MKAQAAHAASEGQLVRLMEGPPPQAVGGAPCPSGMRGSAGSPHPRGAGRARVCLRALLLRVCALFLLHLGRCVGLWVSSTIFSAVFLRYPPTFRESPPPLRVGGLFEFPLCSWYFRVLGVFWGVPRRPVAVVQVTV